MKNLPAHLKNKPLFLSGFMGTGKSSVGKILARLLGRSFIDTDELIEASEGRSIKTIFAKDGEAAFRKLETLALRHCLNQTPAKVISLGGGAVLKEENRKILARGLWVNLDAGLAILEKHLLPSTHRPLLDKKNPRHSIEILLQPRRPFYNLAPFKVQTDGLTPEAVAQKIVTLITQRKP